MDDVDQTAQDATSEGTTDTAESAAEATTEGPTTDDSPGDDGPTGDASTEVAAEEEVADDAEDEADDAEDEADDADDADGGPGGPSLFSHPGKVVADSPAAPAAAPAPAFGLLFQAPDLTDIPARPARKRAAAQEDASGEEAQERPEQTQRARGRSAADEGADEDRGEADTGTDRGGSDDSAEDGDGEGANKRRRRRGGKGRRGRSGSAEESGADSGTEEKSEEDSDAAGTRSGRGSRRKAQAEESPGAERSGDADGEDGESSTKRRRRRRRGEESSERDARSEVSGVKGSTRLEAKRQRRREGREAGRRRTIITEAEFLARRESVERTMVVRGLEDRTQIGVVEDGVLVEHYVSRDSQTTMVGNVYLGRVQNVLPSMEAAFVDIGKGRNAVLYAGEVNWDAAGLDNAPKRIENALTSGESVLVQVTKDPIGHKGARLTSQVSLPGRYLVYVPGNSMTGISRKLPDTERTRLKKILKDVVPADAGVIVRTAAEGASEAELRADVERLTAMWERIQAKTSTAHAPALLHGEADMTVRVIRDVFNEDFTTLVVSGAKAWREVSEYVGGVAPDLADRLERWEGEQDIFTHYRVHESLSKAMDRKVWLPSGGSLVIDRTEAMTVVDVNTGKFVGSGGDLEETVTKNNIEAAEEIVRQLRLRDIGGIIVIDFIDMVLESNRELVVRRLLECLGRDRTKHQVAEVTSLGLVQMTRKRVGSGLVEVFSETCTECNGRGIIVHPEPVERSSAPSEGGGGRGGRGGSRKSRTTSGTPKGGAATLPPPNPNGPTPAQIAAAAHAAAVQATSPGAAAEGEPGESAADVEAAAGEAPTQQAEPAESTPEQSGPTPEQAESGTQQTEATPEQTVPAETRPRGRRRRGRVVAPAGPPGGATVGAS